MLQGVSGNRVYKIILYLLRLVKYNYVNNKPEFNKGDCMKKYKKQKNYMEIYMCWGIAVGTAIGIILDNFVIYMPVGLAVGAVVGSFVSAKNRNKNKNAPEIDGNKEIE